MHKSFAALPLLALAWASAAHAGTEPLYAPAPDWVDGVEIGELELEGSAAVLLYDWQYRIEDGVVHAYTDSAIRIDNPQALMSANTQTLAWLPDKGDITIHRFEIIRDGEVIDLIAQGVTFEVLRREQGLENRLFGWRIDRHRFCPGLARGRRFADRAFGLHRRSGLGRRSAGGAIPPQRAVASGHRASCR